MSSKFVEQLGPRASRRAGSYASFMKRLVNRLMRRKSRKDPEDAPTKPRYRGWFW